MQYSQRRSENDNIRMIRARGGFGSPASSIRPAVARARTVQISLGERSYPIRLGEGILDAVGPAIARRTRASRAAVITVPGVGRRYGGRVMRSMRDAGIRSHRIDVPDGDATKNLRQLAHLYDALMASFKELAKVPDRKCLLLFTDGDDEGSKASREEALAAAQRSFASIYAVGFMGWSFEEGMYVNEDLLTQLATYTGGLAFYPRKEKELSKAFDSIRDELHRQYRMAYLPPNDDGGEGWRNVQVKMTRKKNLTVRTRLGYYNRPEKEP